MKSPRYYGHFVFISAKHRGEVRIPLCMWMQLNFRESLALVGQIIEKEDIDFSFSSSYLSLLRTYGLEIDFVLRVVTTA